MESCARFDPARPPQSKILTWDGARAFADRCRAEGKRLVLANGCFDLLHGGHVSYLEAARAEGDALLVGVNSDASERSIKGPGRPIIPERERAELVAGMGAVDAVVIFDEPDCGRLLREIRPAVHAKGTDYTTETVPERAVALELGVRIAITGESKEHNSKDIVAAVREAV
jgi:rfaE bifunctional protein nucleotidyltransferase chain/domain